MLHHTVRRAGQSAAWRGITLEKHHGADLGSVRQATDEQKRRTNRRDINNRRTVGLIGIFRGHRGRYGKPKCRNAQDPGGKDDPVPARLGQHQPEHPVHQSTGPMGLR